MLVVVKFADVQIDTMQVANRRFFPQRGTCFFEGRQRNGAAHTYARVSPIVGVLAGSHWRSEDAK